MKPGERSVLRRLLPWAKLAVGLLLLLLLVWQGDLDRELLDRIRTRLGDFIQFMIAALAFFVALFLLTLIRWRLLLHAFQIPARMGDVIRLGWIGLLFSQVIPGATGGDVVKGFYIARESPGRKTEAVLSVIVDRFIGLAALLLLVLVAIAIHHKAIAEDEQLTILMVTLAIASAGIGLAGAIVLFAPPSLQRWIERTGARLPAGALLVRLASAIWHLHSQKRAVLLALLFSLAVQAGIVLVHVLVARALDGEFPPVGLYFFLIPIGQLGFALPVSPGGLGVAEGAYSMLFQRLGSAHGAEVALCYRIVMATCSVAGIYFYLRGKKALAQVARNSEEM